MTDFSKAVREMVTRGRLLFAVEQCKKGEASLGRAAELAGIPLGQMITVLAEFGVESKDRKRRLSSGDICVAESVVTSAIFVSTT